MIELLFCIPFIVGAVYCVVYDEIVDEIKEREERVVSDTFYDKYLNDEGIKSSAMY